MSNKVDPAEIIEEVDESVDLSADDGTTKKRDGSPDIANDSVLDRPVSKMDSVSQPSAESENKSPSQATKKKQLSKTVTKLKS